MSAPAGPRGALRVGDRVRFSDRVHTVVGLSGTTVHLVDDVGVSSLMLFSHLVACKGFELLDSSPEVMAVPPFGLLDTVPESVVRKARFWERHLIEIETGIPPDAPEGTAPRVEYDPHWRTLEDRITAKAAELAATGHPTSTRTLERLRSLWRDHGLWGLVDRRSTRTFSPTGQADERVVAVLMEVLAEQTAESTGTRSRVQQELQRRIAERYGPDMVPMPSRATFFRTARTPLRRPRQLPPDNRHHDRTRTTCSRASPPPASQGSPSRALRLAEPARCQWTSLCHSEPHGNS